MFFRWKKGLPNQSQGKKIINVTSAGGVEMIPGKIYKFDNHVAEILRTIPSVEELDLSNSEVNDLFGNEEEFKNDLPLRKPKKINSEVLDMNEALEKMVKNSPEPIEGSVE